MENDLRSMLLGTLTSGGSREAVMQQLLQQADLDEPTTAMMNKMLAERAAYAEEEDEPEPTDEVIEREEKLRRLTDLLSETQEKLERVYAEVEELRRARAEFDLLVNDLEYRSNLLSAALGICHECLGDDEKCPDCQGHGYSGSGFYQPDIELYRHYVAPLVQAKGGAAKRRMP